MKDLTKEELIKKMVSVEFNRFINYYKKNRDLSAQSAGSDRRSGEALPGSDGAVRYFVNIGDRDNFDWMSLKDFLRDTLGLGRDDIFKVDVKEGFSFFNTDAQHADMVLNTLNAMHLEGRRINVEISKNDGASNNRRRDHNGRSGGGERGGFSKGPRSGGGERRGGESFGGGRPPRREGSSERPPRRGEGRGDTRNSSGGSRERRPRRS